MANKSALELAVGTGQWDAGLKKAKDSLNNFTQAQGGLQSALKSDSDKMQQFVQMMGKMDSSAKTAKGQLNDYKGTIEQLTMQYNRMTDAQKKTIGQDYLQAIDQLKQKYQSVNKEIEEMNRQLKATPEITPSVSGGGGLFGGDKFSGMLQVFGGNVMTKLAGVGVGFVSEIGDMVKQGIELAKAGEGVRIAFERLNQPGLLDNLREATHGTVTDLELMKAAVKFNDFKLPVEELGTMLAFAQQKAKDTGQSVEYMTESIVTGLGRKSLMILDNLGLSAAEIKERMKETGDMTKAVGAIIREQMAKAGDYVETAADRATQANVELTNAMTRLGETFQPVTDMGTSMWTSLKVGALDLLNNVVTPLINKFTELGRIRQQYADQGGDERVSRMLGRLRGIGTDTYRQGTYKAQLANFDTKIGSYQQYLADYKKWQGDKTAVGAYDRMQAFQKQTGLSMYSDVKEQLAVFQKMRAEYVQGAKAILAGNPAPSPADTTPTPTGGGGGTTSVKLSPFVSAEGERAIEHQEYVPMWNTADFMEALRKEMGMDGKQTRDWGKEIGKVFADYVDDPDKAKRSKKEKEDGDFLTDFGKVTNSVTNIASGLQSLGVEIPEGIAKTLGVIQTISGILSAILAITTVISASSQANATANWLDALVPFARGGKVPHAATGYYVPGTRYSGDTTPILANAGELVLNKSSQNNLAADLQHAESLVKMLDSYQASFLFRSQYGNEGANFSGGVMSNLELSAIITGEQLRLVLNNNGRRTGRGEYVTTNFK